MAGNPQVVSTSVVIIEELLRADLYKDIQILPDRQQITKFVIQLGLTTLGNVPETSHAPLLHLHEIPLKQTE